jgi:type VI protein secretion system component Hcp
MAESNYDVFLELIKTDGTVLRGETSAETSAAGVTAEGIEINEFDISFGKANPDKKAPEDWDAKQTEMKGDVKKELGPLFSEVRKALKEQKKQIEEMKQKFVEHKLDLQALLEESEDDDKCEFSIKKDVDVATAALIQAYNDSAPASSTPFKKAIVKTYRAGGGSQPLLTLTFGAVRIVKYVLNLGEVPTEDIDFTFGQLEVKYWPQSAKGQARRLSVQFAWDFLGTKPWANLPEK